MRARSIAAAALVLIAAARGRAQEAVRTFELRGRAAVTACSPARCATERRPFAGRITVGGGGVTETLPFACSAEVATLPPIGTIVPGRRGWLVVRVTNLEPLAQLVRACANLPSFRATAFRARLKPSADGRTLRIVERLAGRARVRGVAVRLVVRATGTATEVTAAGAETGFLRDVVRDAVDASVAGSLSPAPPSTRAAPTRPGARVRRAA
jgi:hypothetical protein